MNEATYHALLDLLMCSDPWPCGPEQKALLEAYADEVAMKQYGLSSWIDVYHGVRHERADPS